MRSKIFLFLLMAFFALPHATAQFEHSLEMNLKGLASTGERLPFWMYSNQRGRVSEDSNVATWITGRTTEYFGENIKTEFGAGILYRDGVTGGLTVDELYGHFENKWLYVTAGQKQRQALYNGLSATNENMIYSLNARPLPGLQVGTKGPLFFAGEAGLGLEASWNEYFLGNEGLIDDTKLHHKSFHLLYRTAGNFQIKAGFQHFSHWGGSSMEDGRDIPSFSESDYLDAVKLSNNYSHNVSSYELHLSQDFRHYRIELLYNNIATDRSARKLSNFPDGRYGIFYEEHDKDRLVNSVIYEFYYTKHQDHDSSGGHLEDYFNPYYYGRGWSYKNRMLAVPFFTYDRNSTLVVNNKFTAHHIGIGGQYSTHFKNYPYKLLLSYSKNEGTYFDPYEPAQDVFSSYFTLRLFQDVVDINIEAGTEYNSEDSFNVGAGIHLVYRM